MSLDDLAEAEWWRLYALRRWHDTPAQQARRLRAHRVIPTYREDIA